MVSITWYLGCLEGYLGGLGRYIGFGLLWRPHGLWPMLRSHDLGGCQYRADPCGRTQKGEFLNKPYIHIPGASK